MVSIRKLPPSSISHTILHQIAKILNLNWIGNFKVHHPQTAQTREKLLELLIYLAVFSLGQTFIRRQTWRRHLITHTGEKAYKCDICNVAYVDRRTLRRHLEKVHPGSNIEAYTKPIHAVPVIVDESMAITDIKI